MSRWRIAFVLILLLIPALIFVGVAGWTMWEAGRLTSWWWLMPLSWGLAFLLIRRWQQRLSPWSRPPHNPEMAWTPKDSKAAEILSARQESVMEISSARLIDPRLYLETALELANEIDRHYHPNSKEPYHALTIVEILTAAHLACEDLEEWVEKYVPGSYSLTLKQWRTLSKAPDWFQAASNASWAISVLFNPVNLGRYVTSKMTMGPLSKELQTNMLSTFYVMFVRRLGVYLIEMNSGRLKAGSERYRAALAEYKRRTNVATGESRTEDEEFAQEAFSELETATSAEDSHTPPQEDRKETPKPETLSVAIVGQIGAGKTSLINSLLGSHDVSENLLPHASGVRSYRYQPADSQDELILLDCPGYGGDEGEAERRKEIRIAIETSNLVLLVMKATSPARDTDRELLQEIADWYEKHPRFSPPPVLGVLTHIDGLSPAMEWSPPYDWQDPKGPKEKNIRAALDSVSDTFAGALSGIVPVRLNSEADNTYGIQEWLIPTIVALLDSAHACSLLRTLDSEVKKDRTWKVLGQLYNAGAAVLAQTAFSGRQAQINEGEDPR